MKTENYTVIQIDDASWRIETEIVRSYLFVGKERAMLVDTTEIEGNLDEVVRQLTDMPVILVNTHADGDHIASNTKFDFAYMHPAELYHYEKHAKPGIAQMLPLQDGEIIDLGERHFEVILIPGHTYGSIALLDKENRLLIAGDTVSESHIFLFGEARNPSAFRISLNRLKERSGEYDKIYSSHGPYSVGVEQIDNILLCLEDMLAGKLTPEEPFMPVPAKMYQAHGARFYY